MNKALALPLAWLGTSLAAALVLFTVQALADGSATTDTVPRELAYQGTLDMNGAPFDGNVTLALRLFDGAGSTSAVWTETQTVTVDRGAFNVSLGATSGTSAATLGRVVAAADDVYLEVSLVTDGGEAPFPNRQRLVSVSHALWASAASQASVGRSVTVDSTGVNDGTSAPVVIRDSQGATLTMDGGSIDGDAGLTLSGDPAVRARGPVTVEGTDISFQYDASTTKVALRHVTADALAINPDESFGSTRIYSAFEVTGLVSGIEGTASVTGCSLYNHQPHCPSGKFIQGAQFASGGTPREFSFICCSISSPTFK